MGITEATRTCFSKYATFSGRASRPEFWWFMLVYLICMAIASAIDTSVFGETSVTATIGDGEATASAEMIRRHRPAQTLAWLVFFLPVFAAAWRRMQDTGRPGATLLIPYAISLAAGLFLFLGVLGFAVLEMVGLDGQVLRAVAASMGLAGILFAAGLFIAMRILILVWLIRPSQKGANQYGLEPAL
jgi:uncharacterized membrane protein YhaH (DUF805 family)